MRNVFISYSRDDLDMVEKEVIPKIEEINGVKCWLDVHDIEAGAESFPDVINNGLKECFIFLLMLSKSSQPVNTGFPDGQQARLHGKIKWSFVEYRKRNGFLKES